MTLLLLVVWLILTRWGSSVVVWPPDRAATPSRSPAPPNDGGIPLDRTSVTLEAVVAGLVVALVPFTFVSEAFSDLERIGLAALSPFVVRYAFDRIAKLRAGRLAIFDDAKLTVPGLPTRSIEWNQVTTVKVRRVSFGPNDVVIEGRRLPIVIDTQFTTLDDDELIASVLRELDSRSR
jgi:hypothetical protein